MNLSSAHNQKLSLYCKKSIITASVFLQVFLFQLNVFSQRHLRHKKTIVNTLDGHSKLYLKCDDGFSPMVCPPVNTPFSKSKQ